MTPEQIMSLAAVAGSAASVIIAWRRTGPEMRKQNSDIATAYQELARRQAEVNTRLEDELESVKADLKALQAQLLMRDRLIADWQVGIDRLLAQMKAQQITPVWVPTRVE